MSAEMENVHEEQPQPRDDLMTLKAVFFHSVLVDPKSIPQFMFYEDVSVLSATDRYILLDKQEEVAIFHVTGMLTYLSVTAAGAVKHRKPEPVYLDEYTARLNIDKEKDQHSIDKGFEALIDLLKSTKKACENIAVLSGLVEKRSAFRLEETTVKVSNYSNHIFYFNRKVATKNKQVTDDGATPDFLLTFPQQGKDYPSLKYPRGWHLTPLIPVTDTEALQLQPENNELPRRATVYFEIRQGCHNFEGLEGPVRQIVLIPWVIAIKVHPIGPQELTIAQKAKRRRLSC